MKPASQVVAALFWARVVSVALVAGVVALLAWCVVAREQRVVAPRARWSLAANHQLAAGDLVSDPVDALTGRTLRNEVRAGDPVTLDMTTDQRSAQWPGNTLAAILTIPAATPGQPPALRKGMAVDIRNGDKTLASGEVLGLDCGPQTCSVVVGISKHTDVDTAALQGATVRPGAAQ